MAETTATREVSNRRGIYYRIGQDGSRRYEISYTDSDARRRWKTVGTRVPDAQDALDELRCTGAAFRGCADPGVPARPSLHPIERYLQR